MRWTPASAPSSPSPVTGRGPRPPAPTTPWSPAPRAVSPRAPGAGRGAGAPRAAQAVVDGADLPPLHGVPTAIKDLNNTAGVRTTFGSRVLAAFVPDVDDAGLTALAAAGTISLGKTNTPEFGFPCYTENDVAGPARCPWDSSLLAAGSSGGAAAAQPPRPRALPHG